MKKGIVHARNGDLVICISFQFKLKLRMQILIWDAMMKECERNENAQKPFVFSLSVSLSLL